ncbi:hypothetical protein DERF_010201 [Dermatophagoides farinae]|uniref:Nicastrin n=1 Tax=Dermatophagoides farinae TaxID=6954 RepID=A0A922HYG9_DERFA|nr:hypothetical protein DERF_010201 [Dermatophagoides farinae]
MMIVKSSKSLIKQNSFDIIKFSLLLLMFILINQPTGCHSGTVEKKIYHEIQVQNFCFLRFNATNQIGCSDSKFGNEGLIKIINNDNDMEEIKSGQSAYVPVITSKQFNFTTLMAFKKSDHVAGVLVLDYGRPASGFSSDRSCPNQMFDLYTNDDKYGFCRKIQWNKPNPQHYDNGLLYEHWPFPIFFLRNQTDIDWLLNKTAQHQDWPKLAAEFKAPMHGAVDSITCTRRSILSQDSWFSLMPVSFCEPLGGINIYSHTFKLNDSDSLPDNSVVVLATRLDTFSMFDGLAPGADSVMSSLITIIAIAEILYRPDIQSKLINNDNRRSLFIALFDGEAFDYIGSSSAAFQMKEKIFPLPKKRSDEKSLQFDFSKIFQWIEFEQIGLHKISEKLPLYLHKNPGTNSKQLINIIQNESNKFKDLQMNETPDEMPLPPSSVQSFLKLRKDIEHIVITNHRDEFINKYYNSLFDDGSDMMNSIEFKKSYLDRIKSVATLFARVVYQSITGQPLDLDKQADEELISMLMECLLHNSNCKLFSIILQPSNITAESNNDDGDGNGTIYSDSNVKHILPPYPSYVSVYQADPRTKILRQYIRRILNYFTGENMHVAFDKCVSMANSDPYHTYLWQMGQSLLGECVRSNVFTVDCVSPAFDGQTLDIRKSFVDHNEYAAWTESKWDAVSLRIFVQPNPLQQYLIVITGVVISIVFVTLFVYFNRNYQYYFRPMNDTCQTTENLPTCTAENITQTFHDTSGDNRNVVQSSELNIDVNAIIDSGDNRDPTIA